MGSEFQIKKNGVVGTYDKLWHKSGGAAPEVDKAWVVKDGKAELWYITKERYGVTALEFNVEIGEGAKADTIYLNIYKDNTLPTNIYLNDNLAQTVTTQGSNSVVLFEIATEDFETVAATDYVLKIESEGTYYLYNAAYDSGYGESYQRMCCIYAESAWHTFSGTFNEIKCNIKYAELDSMCTRLSNKVFWDCTIEDFVVPRSFTAFLDTDNYGMVVPSPNTIYKNIYVQDIDAWFAVAKADAFSAASYNLYFNNSLVKTYNLPANTTEINDYMFSGWKNLKGFTIPKSVTSIGKGAFSNCTGLTSISIPNSVISIGERAFSGSGITSFEIPNSLSTISNSMFAGCESLTSIVIPINITKIEQYAFTTAQYGVCYLSTITFNHTADDTLALETKLFASKNAYELTVNHYGNAAVTGYDYAGDNATVTFVDFREV